MTKLALWELSVFRKAISVLFRIPIQTLGAEQQVAFPKHNKYPHSTPSFKLHETRPNLLGLTPEYSKCIRSIPWLLMAWWHSADNLAPCIARALTAMVLTMHKTKGKISTTCIVSVLKNYWKFKKCPIFLIMNLAQQSLTWRSHGSTGLVNEYNLW